MMFFKSLFQGISLYFYPLHFSCDSVFTIALHLSIHHFSAPCLDVSFPTAPPIINSIFPKITPELCLQVSHFLKIVHVRIKNAHRQ